MEQKQQCRRQPIGVNNQELRYSWEGSHIWTDKGHHSRHTCNSWGRGGVGGDSDGYTHFSQAHCPIHYQLGERGQCQPRPAAEGVALTMHCFLPAHNRPHSLLGVDNSVNGTRRPTELSLNCTGQNDYSYYSAWTVMLGGE